MNALTETLPAYSGSMTKRLMKTPKLYFTDTGLLAYLQNLTIEKIKFEPTGAGQLMENFVVGEIKKQTGWTKTRVEMFHFRTSTDHEVDIVLELPSGEIVGIEIKAGAQIGGDAFKRTQGSGSGNRKEVQARNRALRGRKGCGF